jgi:histidinol-phosphate aminotransferase
MTIPSDVSRRVFVGGVATTLVSSLALRKEAWAQARAVIPDGTVSKYPPPPTVEEFDALAKLASNENPYGPSESVLKAMTQAFKYTNRYGYPDGGLVQELSVHHGVKAENILLGAGSSEILKLVGTAFLSGGKKVVGVEPTYSLVYEHATGIKSDAIRLPLTSDHRQDIATIVKATKTHYRDVGFVYVCNPNNPTGVLVTKREIKQLLDALPEDMPVLIDEAYHHYVDDPNYATSVPYVLEGRPVIIARTFSKISALAGMRLGYAIAPAELIQKIRPWSYNSVNAIVKWGGVAALRDTESQTQVKKLTIALRDKTTKELQRLGYEVIPSQANFFMVGIKRPVTSVLEQFRHKGVLVGRPFPPLNEHLRVSVGTAEEMDRFTAAFKEIFAPV